jgi:hypothetical protein
MRKFALIPAALLLAGCSAPSEADTAQTPPDESPQMIGVPPVEEPRVHSTDDTWVYVADGTEGTIRFGAEPDPQLEQFIAGTDNPHIYSYAAVDVDNRYGESSRSGIGVNLYTPEGQKVECDPVAYTATMLQDVENDSEEMYDLLWDMEEITVSAGERREVTIACPKDLPDEVARVTFSQGLTEFPAWVDES